MSGKCKKNSKARLEMYTIINEEAEIFKKSLLFLMIPLPAAFKY